ncbi:hypothetical protein [Nocardia huaxiensis]|uniref:Uncharacterized protein n=1 Tax=Nocardia huaxiensis TaxID=2755382 RepID=A0A7D6VBM5_9NOCA|nr:hypothetical protein [Nocardia huaxiensis]QLY31191.1 hypothetical protein H0264_02035 [Nocardia huaxiensis]UFS94720.1 hypothetical protein LPY97_28870 [Nocardia huaxiensis]
MSEHQVDREMWEQSKAVDAMLGITEEWMYNEICLRDAIRAEFALKGRIDDTITGSIHP